jgi:hypothetical protein
LLDDDRCVDPLRELAPLQTGQFRATIGAWRAVLKGVSEDLSACGAQTLDRWAAELLATALGLPAGRVEELRRELRRRGVAAFGMLAQAA